MTKVLLVLVAFAVALNAINAQYYINDVLLRVRQEYIAYKWNCLQTLDITYSRIYSTLNTTLFQIIEPYLRQNSLLWACQSFQVSKLNKSTASRLKNACNVITSTYALSIPNVHNAMMSFYSGLLGSPSESQETGQEVFLAVEDSMNALVPLYIAKPICVGSLLKSFVGTYKNVTDNISSSNQRTINNVARIFTNASVASRSASNTINIFRNNLVTCNSSREADVCIRKMVNLFLFSNYFCKAFFEN